MRATCRWMMAALLAGQTALFAAGQEAKDQDAKAFVAKAVQNELAKDAADHTHWLYFESDQKPGHPVKQWVAETSNGSLKRVVQMDGHPLSEQEQKQKVDQFLADPSNLQKQRKSSAHDDKEATQMLEMLPKAFIWTNEGEKGENVVLHFKPDPNFNPPNLEAKVFAAMEGNMEVNKEQLRIASLKGKLVQTVKIFGGVLGELDQGGTFDVERRETGTKGIWQITETHVHIQGHALLFKTISEQEDDVKTDFKQLPSDATVQSAKNELLEARQGGEQTASAKGR